MPREKRNRTVWSLRESDIRSAVEHLDLTEPEIQRVCRDIEIPEWGEYVIGAAEYVKSCRKDKKG